MKALKKKKAYIKEVNESATYYEHIQVKNDILLEIV